MTQRPAPSHVLRAGGPAAAAVSLAALVLACAQAPPAPSAMTSPPTTVAPAPAPPPPAPQEARYEVRFESVWSASTHPTDFPDNAHYSPLVGGTHDGTVSFWQVGLPASEGIRAMAERGRTSPLDQEIGVAISSGTAEFLLQGEALDTTPGSVSLTFDITQRFPRVTLVTMVAPSPDWFVGVSGLPLFESGQWREVATMDLLAYDAGTDSGQTFESTDEPTDPPMLVHLISGYPITSQAPPAPLARMVFTRQ